MGSNRYVPTLAERINDIIDLFKLRISLYLRSDKTTPFLRDGIRGVGKMVRKHQTENPNFPVELVSVFSRGCAFLRTFEGLEGLPVIEMLSRKFPCTHCAFCKELECVCPDDRKGQVQLAEVNPEQLKWTIQTWSEKADQCYGKKNRSIGYAMMFIRLSEEADELIRTPLIEIETEVGDSILTRKLIASEFADYFMWAFAFAGRLSIDFDAAIEKHYPFGGVHHRCKRRPCICGPFQRYLPSAIWPELLGKPQPEIEPGSTFNLI